MPAAAALRAGCSAVAATLALGGAPALAQTSLPASGSTGGADATISDGASLPELGTGIRRVETPLILPGVRSTLGFSDNIELRPPGQERSDTVLEVSPYIEARSENPLARYSVFYQMRNFVRAREGDTDTRHVLNANGSFALQDDNLWLDAFAYSGSVATTPSGVMSINPTGMFVNRSSYNYFSVSPWYQNRLGSWATYNLRYSYAQPGGTDTLPLANWHQFASASISGIDEGRNWNWSWYGRFGRDDYRSGAVRDRRNSGALLSYRVNDRLRVSGGIDYEQIDYVFNEDGDDFGWGPSASVEWNPNSRLTFSANVSERYYGNVGSARLAWNTARSTLGVAYSRSLQTSYDPRALTLDPITMTTGLPGTTNIAAVGLRDTGLLPPGGTPINGSLVTDAARVEKRLSAFWGLNGASRSLTLSGWLLDSQRPTQVLESTGVTNLFVGEFRERGAMLLFSQRLDGRSRAEAAIDYRITSSPTFENGLTTLRAGIFTDIDRHMTAFGGFRISRQNGSGTGTDYDENAVFGGLDYRFR